MSNRILSVCLLLALTALLNSAFVKSLSEEEWVDPGDMLHYDYNSKSMIRDKVIPKEQKTKEIKENDIHSPATKEKPTVTPKSCDQPEFHFYKRFIRSLIGHFTSELHLSNDVEDMQFDVLMKLTESELAMLKSYVSPASKVAIQDVDEILTHLIKRVRLHRVATEYGGGITWLEQLMMKAQDNAGVICSIVASVFVILVFRQLSPSRAFVLGMVLLFVVGTVYEGINMYQKLEAEKFAERHKLSTVPEHCNPKAVNVFRRIGWSLQVNLLGMDDPCKKYYELLMVDTRFQINPLQVAASALGKVFETMAKFAGSAFGLFYSKALEHFNFLEKIVFVAVLTVVSVVAVMYMGPAMVFSLPSLMRGARRAPIREMIEDIPKGQQQLMKSFGNNLKQNIVPAIALAPCSKCGSQEPVHVEQVLPIRSTLQKITITSGNKCISIEDVEPIAIESAVTCAATGNSDYESSEENPPESSATDNTVNGSR